MGSSHLPPHRFDEVDTSMNCFKPLRIWSTPNTTGPLTLVELQSKEAEQLRKRSVRSILSVLFGDPHPDGTFILVQKYGMLVLMGNYYRTCFSVLHHW